MPVIENRRLNYPQYFLFISVILIDLLKDRDGCGGLLGWPLASIRFRYATSTDLSVIVGLTLTLGAARLLLRLDVLVIVIIKSSPLTLN